MTSEESEINDIIRRSSDKAEEYYPKGVMPLRTRIVVALVLILLVSNSVLGIINTASNSRQADCQAKLSAQLTKVRNDDTRVIDTWVNAVTDAINDARSQNWTGEHLQAVLDHIRSQYNSDRQSNNDARAKLMAQSCKSGA